MTYWTQKFKFDIEVNPTANKYLIQKIPSSLVVTTLATNRISDVISGKCNVTVREYMHKTESSFGTKQQQKY